MLDPGMRPAGSKKARTRFRRAREAAGLSQIGLSRLVERSTAYVSHIENGRLNPSRDERVKLAERLGVDAARLFAGFPKPRAVKNAELGEQILKLCGEYSDGEIARRLKLGRGKVRGRRIIAGGETRPSLAMLTRQLAQEGKLTSQRAGRKYGLDPRAIRLAIDDDRLRGEKLEGPFGPHRYVYVVDEAEFAEDVEPLRCRYPRCERPTLAASGYCGPHARALETRGEWWSTAEGQRFLDGYAAGSVRATCWLCGSAKDDLAPAHFAKAWREERRMVCRTCGPLWIAALIGARSRASVARTDMEALESALAGATAFEEKLHQRQQPRRGQPRHVAIDMVIEALFVGRGLSHTAVAHLLTRAVNRGALESPVSGAVVDRDYVKTRQRRAGVKRRPRLPA